MQAVSDDVHQMKLNKDKPVKKSQDGDEFVQPMRDDSITLSKFHKWQFYPNFDKLQELHLKIVKMQQNYETIPDELKEEYSQMISQGFTEWKQQDYVQFIKAFRRRPIDDIEGIASEIDSKSVEQVQHYLNVFLTRFRETKERDIVIKKF